MSIEFGVRLPNSGPFATAEHILHIGERAEALGFDSVWVHDHVTWGPEMRTHFAAGSVEAVQDQDPNFFESITSAAIAGAMWPQLNVGVAGLILPLRDPRILAKQLATIDQLIGGGRLTVAMGIGAMEADFAVMGVPKRERGRIANAYIAALRALLDGPQPVTFDSPYVSFENATFLPQPSDVQLWVAGRSEAAQRRAASYADGWLASPGAGGSLESFRAMVDRLHGILDEGGRDPETFTVGLEIFMSIGPTTKGARDVAAGSLVERFGSVESGLAATLVGDRQAVEEGLRGYIDAGAKSVELKFIARDVTHMVEMMDETANLVAGLRDSVA